MCGLGVQCCCGRTWWWGLKNFCYWQKRQKRWHSGQAQRFVWLSVSVEHCNSSLRFVLSLIRCSTNSQIKTFLNMNAVLSSGPFSPGFNSDLTVTHHLLISLSKLHHFRLSSHFFRLCADSWRGGVHTPIPLPLLGKLVLFRVFDQQLYSEWLQLWWCLGKKRFYPNIRSFGKFSEAKVGKLSKFWSVNFPMVKESAEFRVYDKWSFEHVFT